MIWLLYARNVGRSKWRRIVGPMWTDQEAVDKSIAANVNANFEYKAVRYVLADEQDYEVDDAPSWLDPRVSTEVQL